ncbi:energy transducer TonB [Telmatospirillum siberiense]|uniref:Energy transducer TonB n=2 Tax=Telmatospirillum siberiense TaxID=382514 RepID=A0A2N3PUD7_9PROT|nr:energy transducer TonB [Telmatospirillum siberiense]
MDLTPPRADDWDLPRTKLWSTSALVILALHLGAVLAAVVWPPHVTEPPPPPSAMMIDMAPLPTPPAAPPPAPKPPEPKPVRPIEKAIEPPARKPPAPVARVKPPTAVVPPPVVEPAVALPAETAPRETRPAPAQPSATAEAPAQTPSGNAKPTWQGLLLAHLERYKRYPASARARRQEGVATVRFVMDRSGAVLSAKLERSSGSVALDEEGIDLLERAQPLPAPPVDIPGEHIELVVPVQFFLR